MTFMSSLNYAGKKQWMKSVMDTESAFTKELKRFLCSSQSWEPVLDLSSQCQQASMALAGLPLALQAPVLSSDSPNLPFFCRV